MLEIATGSGTLVIWNSSHSPKGNLSALRVTCRQFGHRSDEPIAPYQRWVTPMSEVPSRGASDGTSFGVKQLVRKEAVESMARNERERCDSPLFHLDLAQLQRLLYATFGLSVGGCD